MESRLLSEFSRNSSGLFSCPTRGELHKTQHLDFPCNWGIIPAPSDGEIRKLIIRTARRWSDFGVASNPFIYFRRLACTPDFERWWYWLWHFVLPPQLPRNPLAAGVG